MIVDPDGDRFKAIERDWKPVLPSRTYVVVRVDGRAFHTWTRGLTRPFDPRVAAAMDAVTAALCSDMPGSIIGYTQSDEASIVASDLSSPKAIHWFGGSVQKIVSVAAAVATATFNRQVADIGKPDAAFDARVFPLADSFEVVDYLNWRRSDARRNSVSMLCDSHLKKKATFGIGTADRVRMLAEHGVLVGRQDSGMVNGRKVLRETRLETVTWTHKRTNETLTTTALRSHWEPAPVEQRFGVEDVVIKSEGTT